MDEEYLKLLKDVLDNGEHFTDRTGVGTRSVFGRQYRVDLKDGFPLLTTKKVHWPAVVTELEWFLRGRTDVTWLQERGVKIWNEWSDIEHTARFGRQAGDLGPVYGHQWRNFGASVRDDGNYADDGVDQIANLVEQLRSNPASRRLVVNAWNPVEANQVALPPCHTLFQCSVRPSGRLDMHLYQRSGDLFLGVPFNTASYAALMILLARCADLEPGDFVHSFGDLHLYENHVEHAHLQLSRAPRPLPTLLLDEDVRTLDDFAATKTTLNDYNPHPRIAAPVAV